MRRVTIAVRVMCVVGLSIAIAGKSAAQQSTVVPATAFVMPDVPDGWNRFTTYDGPRLSAHFNVVAILDYNSFSQDDESVKQSGEQKDQWDLRTWRLMTRGRLKFAHPVDYFVSMEVKGK